MCFSERCKTLTAESVCLTVSVVTFLSVLLFVDTFSKGQLLGIFKREDRPLQLCTFQGKLGYLKTHKTGSSTLFNILFRVATSRNLNLAMKEKNEYGINKRLSNKVFQTKNLKAAPWHHDFMEYGQYDMIILHARWNYKGFKKLLGPTAKHVTILRNPTAQFESAYAFFKYQRKFGMDFQNFIQNLSRPETTKRAIKEVFNLQIKDLGAIRRNVNNKKYVQTLIQILSSQFDLVMITERFEESLVLLADLLCVPLRELVYRPKKVRPEEEKVQLHQETETILKQHQYADEALYSHFKQKFKIAVLKFGHCRMEKSVAELRQYQAEMNQQCSEITVNSSDLCSMLNSNTLENLKVAWENQLNRWKKQKEI